MVNELSKFGFSFSKDFQIICKVLSKDWQAKVRDSVSNQCVKGSKEKFWILVKFPELKLN